MPRYELLLEAEFSAAHRLRLPGGTLEPLHGHNWRVQVYLEGDRLDASGMAADFTVLQPRLRSVTDALHNTDLNDHPALGGASPSTEIVARHIHDALGPQLPPGVRLTKVRVWETAACAAAYVPD